MKTFNEFIEMLDNDNQLMIGAIEIMWKMLTNAQREQLVQQYDFEYKIIKIGFEVPEDMSADDLHEMLCLLIHEGDNVAGANLQAHVSDIQEVN